MVKQQIRDYWRLFCSLLFSFLYAPHLLIVIIMDKKMIFSDILRMRTHEHIKLGKWTGLIFFLHTNSYFRTLFYHRIGAIPATLIDGIVQEIDILQFLLQQKSVLECFCLILTLLF